MPTDHGPQPGGYRPYGAARAPQGRPTEKPRWRVLVHRKSAAAWAGLTDAVGLESVQQLWDHICMTPDQPPTVGSSVFLRGHHHRGKWPGYSRTVHYGISGAGRIDYQYNPASTEGSSGEPHPVVKILYIDLSSH